MNAGRMAGRCFLAALAALMASLIGSGWGSLLSYWGAR